MLLCSSCALQLVGVITHHCHLSTSLLWSRSPCCVWASREGSSGSHPISLLHCIRRANISRHLALHPWRYRALCNSHIVRQLRRSHPFSFRPLRARFRCFTASGARIRGFVHAMLQSASCMLFSGSAWRALFRGLSTWPRFGCGCDGQSIKLLELPRIGQLIDFARFSCSP